MSKRYADALDEVQRARTLAATAAKRALLLSDPLPKVLPPVGWVAYTYRFENGSGPTVPGCEPGVRLRLETVEVTEYPGSDAPPSVSATGCVVKRDGSWDRRRTYNLQASSVVHEDLLRLHADAKAADR